MSENGEDARVARTRSDVSRGVLRILADEGWDGVTHARVARAAGYSKTTLYTHWPSRFDLLRIAVESVGDLPHSVPTGDVRADLVREVTAFRAAVVDVGLDRLLLVMAQRGASVDEISAVRARVVADGERVARQVLETVTRGVRLDVAVTMLSGVVLCPIVMYGTLPDDDAIATAVDVLLDGLGE